MNVMALVTVGIVGSLKVRKFAISRERFLVGRARPSLREVTLDQPFIIR